MAEENKVEEKIDRRGGLLKSIFMKLQEIDKKVDELKPKTSKNESVTESTESTRSTTIETIKFNVQDIFKHIRECPACKNEFRKLLKEIGEENVGGSEKSKSEKQSSRSESKSGLIW